MSAHDKAQFLREHMRMIQETLDLSGLVLVTDDMVLRWPPCEDGCRSPTTCTIEIYKMAASALTDKAVELSKVIR